MLRMSALVEQINGRLRGVPAWPLYFLGVIPAVWFLYLGLTGGLGAEPIKALERALGEKALQLMVVVLAITPLRRFAGINLLKFRRAIGLLAFFYVTVHLLVWLFLDVQILPEIWKDILKRPYVTIGMTGFALMIPLAVTSNNWSVHRLGSKWRLLHRLTYAVALLGAIHYVWLAKGFQIEPLAYLAAMLALLAMRIRPARRNQAA